MLQKPLGIASERAFSNETKPLRWPCAGLRCHKHILCKLTHVKPVPSSARLQPWSDPTCNPWSCASSWESIHWDTCFRQFSIATVYTLFGEQNDIPMAFPWHPVKNQTPVGEQQSLEACELLAGTSPGNAARVINEELKEVSDQEVQAGPEVVLVCPGYIMAWLV